MIGVVARRRPYFVLRVLYATLILFVLWATYSSAKSFPTRMVGLFMGFAAGEFFAEPNAEEVEHRQR